MSAGQISKAKQQLVKAALIRIQKGNFAGGRGHVDKIVVVDVWHQNHAMYHQVALPIEEQAKGSPGEGSLATDPPPQGPKGSPGEGSLAADPSPKGSPGEGSLTADPSPQGPKRSPQGPKGSPGEGLSATKRSPQRLKQDIDIEQEERSSVFSADKTGQDPSVSPPEETAGEGSIRHWIDRLEKSLNARDTIGILAEFALLQYPKKSAPTLQAICARVGRMLKQDAGLTGDALMRQMWSAVSRWQEEGEFLTYVQGALRNAAARRSARGDTGRGVQTDSGGDHDDMAGFRLVGADEEGDEDDNLPEL